MFTTNHRLLNEKIAREGLITPEKTLEDQIAENRGLPILRETVPLSELQEIPGVGFVRKRTTVPA